MVCVTSFVFFLSLFWINELKIQFTFSVSSLEKTEDNILKIPSFNAKIPIDISLRSKELSRERKERRVYKKNALSRRFAKIFRDSAHKLGTDATFGAFDRVAKEMSVTEYNAMVGVYFELAEKSHDLEYALDHIGKAFEILKTMRDRGFQIEESVYGPVLEYLIDMDMVDEFRSFRDVISETSPGLVERLGYYEMLLWIQLGDGEKVEELCGAIDGNGHCLTLLQGKKTDACVLFLLSFSESFNFILIFENQKIICLHCVRKSKRTIFRGSLRS